MKSGGGCDGRFQGKPVSMNLLLLPSGWCWLIEVLPVKYLNDINEQDHRFIKRITR
jgi:putative transposase